MSIGGAIPLWQLFKVVGQPPHVKAHQKGCIQGSKFTCEGCGHEYVTKQGLRQHTRVTHGPEQPAPDEVFVCPFCAKWFWGQEVNERAHYYL